MKMRLSHLAALAVCSLIASGSIAAPFSAAAHNHAIAQDTSSIIGYQQYEQKEKCVIAGYCVLNFPLVSGSQVLIQHVSCEFKVTAGVKVPYAILSNALGASSGYNMLAPNKLFSNSSDDFYSINASTYLFIPSGQREQVVVISDKKNAKSLTCTISGQHVTDPE